MPQMIPKRCVKCGINKAFTSKFQLQAMETNAKTPLFKECTTTEDNVQPEIDTDPLESIESIAAHCLQTTLNIKPDLSGIQV